MNEQCTLLAAYMGNLLESLRFLAISKMRLSKGPIQFDESTEQSSRARLLRGHMTVMSRD